MERVYSNYYDEGGPLFGVGAEYKKFLFDVKIYSIEAGETIDGENLAFYEGATVISAGYKF